MIFPFPALLRIQDYHPCLITASACMGPQPRAQKAKAHLEDSEGDGTCSSSCLCIKHVANEATFPAPGEELSLLTVLGHRRHFQERTLTFHDRDVHSSSSCPGDAAQSWAMGYRRTAAARDHPCSEMKRRENHLVHREGCLDI